MPSIFTVPNKHCFVCPRPGSHEKPDVDLVLLGITAENYWLDHDTVYISPNNIIPYFFTKSQAMTYIDTLPDGVKNGVSNVSYRVVNNPNFSCEWNGKEYISTEPYLFSAVTAPDQVEEGKYSLTIHILPLIDDVENDIRHAIGREHRAFRFSTTEKPIEPDESPCVVYRENDESSTNSVYRKSNESSTKWVTGIFYGGGNLFFNRAVAEINQMQTETAKIAHASAIE